MDANLIGLMAQADGESGWMRKAEETVCRLIKAYVQQWTTIDTYNDYLDLFIYFAYMTT